MLTDVLRTMLKNHLKKVFIEKEKKKKKAINVLAVFLFPIKLCQNFPKIDC